MVDDLYVPVPAEKRIPTRYSCPVLTHRGILQATALLEFLALELFNMPIFVELPEGMSGLGLYIYLVTTQHHKSLRYGE